MHEFSGKPNPEKLKKYGFRQEGETFSCEKKLLGGQFDLTVKIGLNGNVQTELYDCDAEEIYTLHLVAEASGEFVNRVRGEVDKVLQDIEKNCFENTKSELVQKIFDYGKEKYGDAPEYLWEGYDYAVLRRKDTKKWYALIMDVPKKKLKLEGDGVAEILDIRFDAEKLAEKIDGKRFLPAYHMNKKHWITILLDGNVSTEEILEYIDASYQMAKK